jgi:hypothetical protein
MREFWDFFIDSFRWFFGGFRLLWQDFIQMLRAENPAFEEVYLEGMRMNERELVTCFVTASGSRRIGLLKVLEDRHLMIRDETGTLLPTRAFHYYLDYAIECLV